MRKSEKLLTMGTTSASPVTQAWLCSLALFVSLHFGADVSDRQIKPDTQESLQHEVTVTVKLVQVCVTDKKGNPIRDLSAADFELLDNNEGQPITHFETHFGPAPAPKAEAASPQIPQPPPSAMNRKFFLLFDFAFNDLQGIKKSRQAALDFLESKLGPGDEVGLLTFSMNRGLVLHEYLTADHQKVRGLIEGFGSAKVLGRAEDVEGRYWEEMKGLGEALGSTGGRGGGESLAEIAQHAIENDRATYKAQVLNFTSQITSLAQALRYVQGNKQIILFSKGVAGFMLYGLTPTNVRDFGEPDRPPTLGPTDSGYGDSQLRRQHESMSRELASANVTVFAVNTSGKGATHFRNRDFSGEYSLKEIARQSGGVYFDSLTNHGAILEEIQQKTSHYYVLGYSIDDRWDGRYHGIKVRVRRPGCRVDAQGGYFNPRPFAEWTETEKMLQLIDLALAEIPHFENPLRFRLEALPYTSEGHSQLTLIARLSRDELRGIIGPRTELVFLVFNLKNDLVEFRRKETNLSVLLQDAVDYSNPLSLPPGEYQFRVVLRNMDTGRGAVASSEALVGDSKPLVVIRLDIV
jgi:VWFA-related protein